VRGRKPVPEALNALHSYPSHAPKRKEPPALPLQEPPDDLSPGQRECWLHAVANAPQGVLKEADRGVLRAWASVEDALIRASAALGREDMLIDVKGQPFKAVNSNWTMLLHAQRAMKGLAELLGFAPTARARLAVPAQKGFEPPSDPYAFDEKGNPRPTLDDWLAEGDRIYGRVEREGAARRAAEKKAH
jgi:phage terminase small subunit